MIRLREAPMASCSEVRARVAAPRASSRLARFAQAMIRTAAAAAINRIKPCSASSFMELMPPPPGARRMNCLSIFFKS